MKEPATQDEMKERRLEIEYRQLCSDWWQRDEYVLNKLTAASILLGSVGLAVGTVPPERPLITLSVLFAGALFLIILFMSTVKDVHYRDETEALLVRLAAKLCITSSLKDLEPAVGLDDRLDFQELRFPRKIKISSDKSAVGMFPGRVRNWLRKQATFRWILAFYMVCLGIFAILFVLVLVGWIYGLKLPI